MAAHEAEHGEHIVQFYDGEPDLVSSVGRYLLDAAAADETMILIATDDHRRAFERQLEDGGLNVPALRERGQLIALDAATTLACFMTDDGVDRAAFHEVVGGLVRDAVRSGRRVRAYGEMVALLWEAGNVQPAIELELLWNELGAEVPFTLFCAYPSELVFGTEHADAFQRVCCEHSSVIDPHIHEAPVTVGIRTELTLEFAADVAAPGIARRMVVNALREQGHSEGFLLELATVVTELATNAVVHADTPFLVTLVECDSTVRISVYDSNSRPPIRHDLDLMEGVGGRGVALIAALANRWGFETKAGGKVVWAELSSSVDDRKRTASENDVNKPNQ